MKATTGEGLKPLPKDSLENFGYSIRSNDLGSRVKNVSLRIWARYYIRLALCGFMAITDGEMMSAGMNHLCLCSCIWWHWVAFWTRR